MSKTGEEELKSNDFTTYGTTSKTYPLAFERRTRMKA